MNTCTNSGGCRILERGVPVASRRREPHLLFVSEYPSLACDALLYLCKLLLLCVRVDLIGL